MAPITQLAVLGLASAVLAVPHAHNHKRDAHPGAPPAYGGSPPVYGASSSAAAVSSSEPAVYGSSSSAAAVSSSASAPAGYGSSSSAGAVSSSGVPSYSFSGSVSSGYAGPTGGYAHPTGGYSLSTGYVRPTGSSSGPASYSTCTETSTLIFRSSTEYSTYYVTHTIYPGGSSTDAASASASGPDGYPAPSGGAPAPSGGAGGYPSVSAPVSPAGSGSPGSPGAPEGSCVPDVTVTTTEKSTIYVTVGGPTGGAPAPSGGYPGSWAPSPSPSSPAATTSSSEDPAPTGGYPGSWEPAPSASPSPSGGYSAAPSSAPAAPSSAPAAPSSAPAAPSSAPAAPSSYPSASTSAAPAPSSSSPPSYGGGASGYSGKRGLNYNDASLTNMFTGSSHVGWAMNWGSDSDGLDPSIPYIPTMWGTDSMWTSVWDANAEAAIKNGAEWFFGFNEPDMPSQANLSPQAAADAWRQYMEPYAGRVKLVAPAVTSGVGEGLGVSWLTSFLEACSDCTIDAVGQHWYNSDGNLVDNFKDIVNGASQAAGGKPVWVNEFGAIGTDAEKSEFLEEVMGWMDSNDSVLGYGYFMVSDGLLCDGDSPSSYGETYMNYSG